MLLAVSLAARRADAAAVLAAAIVANVVRGEGHRRVAASLGRPVSTVRGWLRAFTSSAASIAGAFAGLVLRDAPDAVALWPTPEGGPGGRAVAVLAAYAAALAERFSVTFGAVAGVASSVGLDGAWHVGAVAWARAGLAASNGRLFCASWWAAGGQHELALTSGRAGAPRSRPGPRAPES